MAHMKRVVKKNKKDAESGKLQAHIELQNSSNGRPTGNKCGANNEQKTKKNRRGMQALLQIHKYQRSTELLIQKLPFAKLVREVTQELTIHGTQISSSKKLLIACKKHVRHML